MRTRMMVAVLLAAMNVCQASAQSSGYPNKPIRWVIPYAPGGGTDIIARPVAQKLSEALGQSIVYDNRGGGGGIIAGEIVAKAPPDGYTLLVPTGAVMYINVNLYSKMPFDPARDFTPITKFATVPNVLVAHPSFPAHTIKELVAHAKANPGKVNWASSGIGAGGHLGMELIRLIAGIKVVHVPFKGAGPASVALLAGEVDLLLANTGVFLAHLKAGRLRAIAVASPKRLAALPDVPTFSESGIQGVESESWYGLVAPTRTPAPIIKLLHDETVKVLNSPDMISRFASQGAFPVANTPERFAEELRSDSVKWARVIKEAGIKLE